MATAFIQHIDITPEGRVRVSGHLSRTGLSVALTERIYVMPPLDGIWEYDLVVRPENESGANVLVPFSVEAPWTGDSDANGARVVRTGTDGPEPVTLLKAKRVDAFSTGQSNMLILEGAHFDRTTSRLVIDIRYSGGCFAHSYALEWDGLTLESNPPQYVLNLVDTSEHDPCRALLSQQLHFDISVPEVSFQTPSTLRIQSPNAGGSLRVRLT